MILWKYIEFVHCKIIVLFSNPKSLTFSCFLYLHRITTWCSWQSFFGGLRWSSRHLWNQDCWTSKTQASLQFRPHDSIHGSKGNCSLRCRKWKWLCLLWKHSLIIHLYCVTSDPSSFLKNMPVIPISKATKRSFMERPPSPERPRYVSTNYGLQCDVLSGAASVG